VKLVYKRLVRHGCSSAAALAVAFAVAVGVFDRSSGEATAASGGVTFSEVGQGTRDFNLASEPERGSAVVLRSRSQATRRLRAWGIDAGATDGIDFSRQSAIVFLAAYQPSGGFRARISKVAALGGKAVVTASVRYEGGEVAAASITRPWVVIAVTRAALARVHGSAVRVVVR
jgi:hypothetical protein